MGFFGNSNEPPSKFRQLDKDVQKEQEEQDELFGRISQDPFGAFFGGRDPFEDMMRQHPFFRGGRGRGMMQQRVQETNDQFTLSMDVPGMKASDLNLQLINDTTLCLTGTRKNRDESGNNARSMMESRMQQCFNLGPVDPSRITADLADGVLVVNATKVAPTKKEPVQIPITEGSARPKL